MVGIGKGTAVAPGALFVGDGMAVGSGAKIGVSVAATTVVGAAGVSWLTAADAGPRISAAIQIASRDIAKRIATSR
jgi:hypothetical protein